MSKRTEDIYEQHAQMVYRYLFSLSGEADIAEELTQETFYQALKSMNTYRGESSPGVWLCAIAKRLWYKELERRRRTTTVSDETFVHLASSDNIEQGYVKRDERLTLYRAMQQLDADTREVMHLRLSGDFSFKDIGEILGKSEVWARVRFYRGKEELAKIIGGGKHE